MMKREGFKRWLWLLIVMILATMGCQASQPESEMTQTPERSTATAVPSTNTPQPTAVEATSEPEPAQPVAGPSEANADVLFVRAVETAVETWTFHVTVAHPDTGWEDYADGWDVILPDGTAILPDPEDPFTRLLLHPHETEQPFTRSQSNIHIPAEVTAVTVRAHDLVSGFGGQEITVELGESVQTSSYEVARMGQE